MNMLSRRAAACCRASCFRELNRGNTHVPNLSCTERHANTHPRGGARNHIALRAGRGAGLGVRPARAIRAAAPGPCRRTASSPRPRAGGPPRSRRCRLRRGGRGGGGQLAERARPRPPPRRPHPSSTAAAPHGERSARPLDARPRAQHP
jgi:hypothetical protein